MFQWRFKWASMVFVQCVFEGSIKGISRIFQGSFKGVTRKIEGLKKVLNVFLENFK